MIQGGEWRTLVHAWRGERERGRACVLATLVHVEGSTYRRAGARALVTRDGQCHGLLSGGCLEADIVARAEEVFSSGAPVLAVYDLRSSQDLVFGLGLGCEGRLEIWLERLAPEERVPFDLPQGTPLELRHVDEEGAERIFVSKIPASPRALIAGAGVDARPLAALLHSLGWSVDVGDRREGVLSEFPEASVDGKVAFRTVDADAAQTRWLGGLPDAFDAVLLMNHHFETDAWFLAEVVGRLVDGPREARRLRYLGLLGPTRRREKLFEAVPLAARFFPGLIRAPAGLDLGGDGPEAVALSIAAEIHAVHHGKDSGTLSGKSGHIHDR